MIELEQIAEKYAKNYKACINMLHELSKWQLKFTNSAKLYQQCINKSNHNYFFQRVINCLFYLDIILCVLTKLHKKVSKKDYMEIHDLIVLQLSKLYDLETVANYLRYKYSKDGVVCKLMSNKNFEITERGMKINGMCELLYKALA